jgi:hypothetical protein
MFIVHKKIIMNVYNSWITHNSRIFIVQKLIYNNIYFHHIINVLVHVIRYFRDYNMDLITNIFFIQTQTKTYELIGVLSN